MAFFQYRATDSAGRPAEGTIRAESREAAVEALRRGGYKTNALTEAPAVAAATAARPAPPNSVVPPIPRPVARVASFPPVQAPAPTPVPPTVAPAVDPTPAPAAKVKTRPSKDNHLYFLFSQLGSYFRAGVTPLQAFDDLTARSPRRYATSLREMAKAVGETGRISDVMARYPYLYPPDVVAMIRAGEESGFLPEAAQRIADQKLSSHRLKRRLGWIFAYFLILVSLMPVIYGVIQGALGSIAAQNRVDGSLPIVETLKAHVGRELGRMLPIALVGLAAGLALIYGWNTMPLRNLRHWLALRFPIVGRRIWAEAMAQFTWASGMISRGGMPPQRVFELAAATVPNLEIRERLLASARSMGETERLSHAIRRTGILPPEYASIVETGEITGDVPRALEQVGRAADVEFETRDRGASRGLTILLIAAIAAFVAVVLALMYKMYVSGLITILTQDPT